MFVHYMYVHNYRFGGVDMCAVNVSRAAWFYFMCEQKQRQQQQRKFCAITNDIIMEQYCG